MKSATMDDKSEASANACVVCGKVLPPAEAFARLQHEGEMLSLCCPLCLEAFRLDMAGILALRENEAILRLLKSFHTP